MRLGSENLSLGVPVTPQVHFHCQILSSIVVNYLYPDLLICLVAHECVDYGGNVCCTEENGWT